MFSLFNGFFDLAPQTTPRLLLRKMTMKDAQDIFAYSQDPEVARHVLWDAQKSLNEAKDYIRYMRKRYFYNQPSSWGIIYQKTGRLIGTIGYMDYDENNSTVEVGYSLSRHYWNQGLMTEALQKVIEVSFEELEIHRIEAQHEIDNPSSGRVMEKCGMKKEGVLRERLYNKGKYADMVLYSILRNEYDRKAL